VTPSLHWYRSSLAHNAPSVAGEDQHRRKAWCAAIDQRGGWGWCRSVAEGVFGSGTSAIRTIVLGPSCVLDVVDVTGPDNIEVELPVHFLDPKWVLMQTWQDLPGVSVASDDFLGDVLEVTVTGDLHLGGDLHTAVIRRRHGERLLVAKRPGPPDDQFADGQPMAFLVRRARGSGRWVQCFGTSHDSPSRLTDEGDTFVVKYDDETIEKIALKEEICRVVDRAGTPHKLRGARLRPEWAQAPKIRPRTVFCPTLAKMPSLHDWESALHKSVVVRLGAAHYRRSESPYGAGRPFSARAAVFAVGNELCFGVRVTKKNLTFRKADALDPGFDNETPDIHSDGVQCYVGAGEGREGEAWRGYLLVPDPDSESVRISAVLGTHSDPSDVTASWVRTSDGYSMLVAIDLGVQVERGFRIPVNVVVNEMYANRERRAGQLALSGGGWVYLKGDREHPASAIVAEVY